MSSSKITEIQNITNNNKKTKYKLRINQRAIQKTNYYINEQKINVVILQANVYISNINRLLKTVKSNVLADFIHSDNKGVIITTNKMATNQT